MNTNEIPEVDLLNTTTDTATSPNNSTTISKSHTDTRTKVTTFEEIQKQLKKTLDHVEQKNLRSSFETLSLATSGVVDNCEQLGLTSDDHPYNAIDREQFWTGLNNCWLYALAQRNDAGSELERLSNEYLFELRDKLVTWADKLEPFGLVDYEMGLWEAEILEAVDANLALQYAAAQAAMATQVAIQPNVQQLSKSAMCILPPTANSDCFESAREFMRMKKKSTASRTDCISPHQTPLPSIIIPDDDLEDIDSEFSSPSQLVATLDMVDSDVRLDSVFSVSIKDEMMDA
ncbi:hypothetical protein INT44_000240 [Umbelopsis vinacea]|uniref:Uncharacterized protein n=1 Tax=Umbelopsis vinacea TaxID=44442 RepID=A0A8H7UBS0_9FUNG|nr:hypothetical protein INT44_000240 [Umbelopsis vinacea]